MQGTIYQHQPVNFCHPFSVYLTQMLLLRDYLTHVYSCHLSKHVSVLNTSGFNWYMK